MNRELELSLNKFENVPFSLREKPDRNVASNTCSVDLARLYHHYYLDSYGRRPPNPDPAQFEYIQFLSDTKDFRLKGGGIGDSTAKKRNSSNELGQAFCRWFLHDHLNITYFAHMDKVLDKKLSSEFSGLKVKRVLSGDAPDYFCAKNVKGIFLAEAKGRYSSISFTNKEFDKWREQFSRVEIRDANDIAHSVKGFIVGTRFATEKNRSSLKSAIYAEDPKSPGELPVNQELTYLLYEIIIKEHFVSVFEKLNQPLVAAALSSGSTIPEQLQIQAISWKLPFDFLEEKEFVGGYWPTLSGDLPFSLANGTIVKNPTDLLRLDQGQGTFVGLERNVFESVCKMVRSGVYEGHQSFHPIEDISPFYSAISLLRDGSILGPADFFIPVGMIQV